MLMRTQVAYLMADISDVNVTVIKDLYENLEALPCKKSSLEASKKRCPLTSSSSNHNTSPLLSSFGGTKSTFNAIG